MLFCEECHDLSFSLRHVIIIMFIIIIIINFITIVTIILLLLLLIILHLQLINLAFI